MYTGVHIVPGTNRTSIEFAAGDQRFSIEELVAMEFVNMKKNAENMAGEAVKDVVLTVPHFFTQVQRQAIIDAARLAGLHTLELMNDGLAVALDYAKSRTFNSTQRHIIYDMGAGSTSATVVEFQTISVKDVGRFNKSVTSVKVLGVRSSEFIGGGAMTERLYRHLIDQFIISKSAQLKERLHTNPRALSRLLKEANRVKQVLSANNEASVSIESLHEDIDFRYKVSRTLFEELTHDLVPMVANVVESAIEIANITKDEIDSLILHGGAARVPFVQRELIGIVGEDKIARNVNADESAVMGAVFRGAALSGQFRVKEVRLSDITPFSYQYVVGSTSRTSLRKLKLADYTELSQTLFSSLQAVPSEMNLTFSETSDFDLVITYEASEKSSSPESVLAVSLTGVTDAKQAMLNDHGCKTSEIMLNARLSNSGIVDIPAAFMLGEIEEKTGFADRMKGMFGGKEKAESAASSPITNTSDKNNVSAIAANEATVTTAVKILKKIPLTITRLCRAPCPLNQQELSASLKKLSALDKLDNDRIARETARNGLEAYIYAMRDHLDNEGFLSFASSAEQDFLREEILLATDWMYGEGDNASLTELITRRRDIESVENPISRRRKEADRRPAKLAALSKTIESCRKFISTSLTALNNTQEQADCMETTKLEKLAVTTETSGEQATESSANPSEAMPVKWEPQYSKADVDEVLKKVEETFSWLEDIETRQNSLSLVEDPVVTVAEIERKSRGLSDGLQALIALAQKPKSVTSSVVRPSESRRSSATSTREGSSRDTAPLESRQSTRKEDSSSTTSRETQSTESAGRKDEL